MASSTARSTCDWRANGSSAIASSVACSRLISSRRRAAVSNSRSAAASRNLFFVARDVGADVVADEGAAFLGHASIDGDMIALIDRAHDVGDALADAGGRDSVGHVEGGLFLAPADVSAMARSIEPVTLSA